MLVLRRPLALAAAGVLAATLTACGTVTVPSGEFAADPTCADVVIGAPQEVLGLARTETSSQGTAAWGSGEDTVVMRCGVTPPGPTTERCTTLEDGDGVRIDWIVSEIDGGFLYTTYGREPAIDVSVPSSAAPDQPSAAALDLSRVVSANTVASTYCIGPGDAA
ncbi:DUF3515 family protein [Brachybacterium sp. J144]|uniref:DUF3515 family protein n=1 Tax=Brachybacterium sp. J144 TaxID=3116487 RepID=UPI002E78F789|nr:DUF3515 family protein [Brachybacterium sp. J144]MEE1649805.1 DUF3515 family protein [Brachybacterium sp. J144]